MNTESFVVASHTPWGKAVYDGMARSHAGNWHHVAAPADLTVERLARFDPTFIFFPHWSSLIPEAVWSRYECVVFHMTDLPYGRGGSPLQNLIVRGKTETVLSAIRCTAEIDAGPVYLKAPLCLHGSAEEIFLRASGVIRDLIGQIIATRPRPVPQHGTVEMFSRRRPEESSLAGLPDLDRVFDHIRMLDAEGYPPAYIDFGDYRVEFTRASRRVGHIHADAVIRRRTDKGCEP